MCRFSYYQAIMPEYRSTDTSTPMTIMIHYKMGVTTRLETTNTSWLTMESTIDFTGEQT